jgi:hypothetical protein
LLARYRFFGSPREITELENYHQKGSRLVQAQIRNAIADFVSTVSRFFAILMWSCLDGADN